MTEWVTYEDNMNLSEAYGSLEAIRSDFMDIRERSEPGLFRRLFNMGHRLNSEDQKHMAELAGSLLALNAQKSAKEQFMKVEGSILYEHSELFMGEEKSLLYESLELLKDVMKYYTYARNTNDEVIWTSEETNSVYFF